MSSTAPVSKTDTFGPWFVDSVTYIKYPVLFILYVFCFNYLLVANTLPISFILLIILHISILGLAYSDRGKFDYNDFMFNDTFTGNIFIDIFKYIVYIGPISSWVLLLFGIALVISVLNRLGYYRDKSDIIQYFGSKGVFYLRLVIGFIMISTLIIYILYAFNLLQLLKNRVNISYEWITYTPFRLLSTTLLLISFIIYYVLTGYTNNAILVFGIVTSIIFYFFNIINKDIINVTDARKPSTLVVNSLSVIFFYYNAIIAVLLILKSSIGYVFMRHETKLLLFPLITWFFISLYNIIISGALTKNTKEARNNNTNIKYISSILIVILIILSSLTVHYSVLLDNQLKVTTDGSKVTNK